MPQQAVQLKQTGPQRYILFYNETALDEIGSAISGRAVTDTLYVSPNGNGTGGSTWARAYTTIQAALDAASTDPDDCTQLNISPHATNYDIDTTGDPTWTGNYILSGSYRNWATIKNSHASATSILKFSGNIGLENITIDCGTGSNNGVIIDGANTKGCFLSHVYFEAEHVTGAQTSLQIANTEYARVEDTKFHGVLAYTKALYLNACKLSNFGRLDFHNCATGVQIVGASSDNVWSFVLLHDCTLALDIDVGDSQFFHEVSFSNCTTNVDDEVGNHAWSGISGEFDVEIEPDNFTGVTVSAGGAGVWGGDTEIRAAATSTVPFKIVAYIAEASANEKYRIRFSADSGSTFFADVMVEGEVNAIKSVAKQASDATDHIFNKGTRISASTKSESGGNTAVVWLKLQEI